jgi:hypothetical protein
VTDYADSFEGASSLATDGWTVTGTHIGKSTDDATNGTQSLKVSPLSGDDYLIRGDVDGAGYPRLQDVWVRFALLVPDWTPFWNGGDGYGGDLVGIDPMLGVFTNEDADCGYFYATADDEGVIGFGPHFTSGIEVPLTEGVWHAVRLRWKTASADLATDGEGQMWLDGVDVSGIMTGARTHSSGLYVGQQGWDNGVAGSDYYIDDLVYSIVGDPGDPDLGGGGELLVDLGRALEVDLALPIRNRRIHMVREVNQAKPIRNLLQEFPGLRPGTPNPAPGVAIALGQGAFGMSQTWTRLDG